MRSPLAAFSFSLILALMLAATVFGQGQQNTAGSQQSGAQADNASQDDAQDVDTIKVNTNLVTVPVIASTRDGIYLSDLRKEEFSVFEDGVQQQVSFFATTSEPFHVVLMLDTSASTQLKLRQIQDAAINFTEQLQAGDSVRVMSFDNTVRDLCEFTNDRALLRGAIKKTAPGTGTKLYDAVSRAMDHLRPIKGRKAIVIFTDGVDWHSDSETYGDNRRALEESGIIVYPIRYNTRAETEMLARRQAAGGGATDLGTIFGGSGMPRTTPPTFPSENSIPFPTDGGGGAGRRGSDRRDYPNISVTPIPQDDTSSGRGDDPSGKGGAGADRSYPPRGPNDGITEMLDNAYKLADDYLNELADKSGGRLVRADNLYALPDAFTEIAAELRTQYSLGYYPTNTARDGKYRKIQVKTTRKNIAVRARPGYRTPTGEVRARRR